MRPLLAAAAAALVATLTACAITADGSAAAPNDGAEHGARGVAPSAGGGEPPAAAIRFNRLGYLPDGRKVAVLCSRDVLPERFRILDAAGREVLGPVQLAPEPGLGGCRATARLDFTDVRTPGEYTLEAGPHRAASGSTLAPMPVSPIAEYAAWNTGRIVYHDDWGDYSTNEPIMDAPRPWSMWCPSSPGARSGPPLRPAPPSPIMTEVEVEVEAEPGMSDG